MTRRIALIVLTLSGAAGAAGAQTLPPLPADLPLDAEGVPARPLDDAELHRLLVALSGRSDVVGARPAGCHAAGHPYGAPGWRSCVEAPRR